MNLEPELSAFLETIRKFREKELEPFILDWEEKRTPLPRVLMEKADGIGLFNFWIPAGEPESALLPGIKSMLLTTQELARSSADLAWLIALQIIAYKLLAGGEIKMKNKILGEINQSASGSIPRIFTIGLWEPGVKTQSEIQSQLNLKSGKAKIIKQLVPLAQSADWLIFSIKTEQGKLGWVILKKEELARAKIQLQPVLGLRLCPRYLVDAEMEIEPERFFGENNFEEVFKEAMGISLLLASASALGVAQSAYEKARVYAQDRYQGGNLIIEQRLISHLLSEMKEKLIEAERALSAIEEDFNFEKAGMLRKRILNQMIELGLDAVQILGGYGYMLDYGQEKRLRDIVMLAHLELAV